MPEEDKLIRLNEAWAFIRSTGDPITQRLLWRSQSFVLQRAMAEKRPPLCEFDVLFFVEAMAEFFSPKEQQFIRRILDGEDLGVEEPEGGQPAETRTSE